MDFQFNTLKENTITILETDNENDTPTSLAEPIIKFGRTEYNQNTIEVSGGNAVSRRHCVIINCKDNVWLYDLESTGTEVNDKKVTKKIPLIGFSKLKIDDISFTITTDKTKLL
jgi:pSer/pThr/pTyr-binding forkhead associated (FHA) protein